jgi:hypothetical protein
MNAKKKNHLDGLHKKNRKIKFFDLPLARFVGKHKNSSAFLSRRGRVDFFYTEDSKLYVTPAEYRRLEKGEKIVRVSNRLDSALSRDFGKNKIYSIGQRDNIYSNIQQRYSNLGNYFSDLVRGAVQGVSMAKMWNLSIVGAVIFGMLTMTMIYKYLGQNVSAALNDAVYAEQLQQIKPNIVPSGSNVFDANVMQNEMGDEMDTSFVTKLLADAEEKKDTEFEQDLRRMVKGYPIEAMIPEIVKQDRIVAAFMVAIAKKESAWGVHVPVYKGQDCYNYWGYRGKNPVGSGGHTCFDSTTDAVNTVAKRISTLVEEYGRNTPAEMVVWKCGSNCEVTGGQAAANKWISDVALYFDQLNKN